MTTVSIIIPVYNDSEGLQKTLLSLKNQKKGQFKYEVIIERDTKGEGSYRARNKAIQKSAGEILAFIDAGTEAREDWLIKGLSYIKKYDYVGGRINLTNTDRSILSHMLWVYANNREFAVSEFMKDSHFSPTTNLFIKKDVIKRVGLFDERLISSGDLEFGSRVFKAGFSQHYANDLVVDHETRSFGGYIRKHKRLAKGFFDLYSYYPNKYKHFKYNPLKIFIPPVWLFSKKSWVSLSRVYKVVVFVLTYFFSIVQHYVFTKHYFLRILKLN